MIITPKIFDASKVIAAQSTRLGGVSPAPFASLNLGLSVQDEEANVQRNRELFFGSLGITQRQLSLSHQVHGTQVRLAREPGRFSGFDAQISNTPGLFLVASVADCTPILIHDPHTRSVAAIHAGWRGTAGAIVARTLALMQQEFGTEGKNCFAFIGACISYNNFEVGAEVAEHFGDEVKRYDKHRDKWFVDLKEANRQQLLSFGVPASQIEVNSYCTMQNNDLFFSHRKEQGRTGRMMAVIGLK